MTKNMGSLDKSIRLILALLFAVLYFAELFSGTFGVTLLVLAAVFLLTSMVGFCPLYTLVGISTSKAKK
ncbi:MAG: DUF2892 domain-containing protein [Bacteroidales bacterium]|nr:DUF2892 domain-containing protein [Bacteroidales bacterium]